uniref:Anoctamin n=1 Tax=Knipowitschia caucasica TaxID=637954 RepID=A0AAV2LQ47_KNICA
MFFCKKAEQETFELKEPLLPSVAPQRTFDYMLVSHKYEDDGDLKKQRANYFIHQLERKNFSITKIENEEKIFYGVRAPKEVFEDYMYLLKVSDSCNWTGDLASDVMQATRIRIVHFILHNTYTNTGENLSELLKHDVFETAFCLHERKEQKSLGKKWARWTGLFTGQPLGRVKNYFGEKVALYYLWLGWYTKLLVPAAALGVVAFLYGLAFFRTNPLIKDVCDSNIIMCPRCDKRCSVWQLSDTCTYAKVNILFDNEGTVAFAMCMAIWATLFLELWKRHRAKFVSKWKVYDWCEEELPADGHQRSPCSEVVVNLCGALNHLVTSSSLAARDISYFNGLPKLLGIKGSHDNSAGSLKAARAASTVLCNMFQYSKLHKDYKLKGFSRRDFTDVTI